MTQKSDMYQEQAIRGLRKDGSKIEKPKEQFELAFDGAWSSWSETSNNSRPGRILHRL
ncbi:hypothetical protein FOQG_17555 [Fusarium oxysporum f. sp. raphani 54005]|uniref:Uncharacterized protein n=1 Tax=Fusarium oxysporum f. sp. raphani 54005 TaxID=1089458 RepID=X0B6J9_FUSOX|nr:hypothetical protein FOQG_17555 [Fusarium oxysporum f. sp. raphani 54005]